MDISIAMCTYNGSKFLGEQLSSILEQTKLPHELVVCDDASTDATSQIVEAFALDAPFPVRFFRNQATLGSTRNFEKAISLCVGQAIALCDQDDIWLPNKLERLASVLDSEPQVGGVCSNAFLMDERSEPFPDSLWERRNFTPRLQAAFQRNSALQLLQYNAATGATFVFRSEFVKQITPIPPEWVHDAWIALLVATQSRVQLVPEKLISYRIHAAQQIGVRPSRLGMQNARATASDALLVRRWTVLAAKLATLPVDPIIRRLVQKRLMFFETRAALKQERLLGRVIAASRTLPGYFRFARGLFSYLRDIANGSYPGAIGAGDA
jgi:glycosyltransferase involved in cell wall biosynthesis